MLGRASDGSIGRDTHNRALPAWRQASARFGNFSGARKETGLGGGTTKITAKDDPVNAAILLRRRGCEGVLQNNPMRELPKHCLNGTGTRGPC